MLLDLPINLFEIERSFQLMVAKFSFVNSLYISSLKIPPTYITGSNVAPNVKADSH